MTMLDDIKQKMHDAIDKAWEALHGTHDLDAARPVAQDTTAALHALSLQAEAQLIKHVADNAAEAETAESAPAEPSGSEAEPASEPSAADKPAATAGGKKAAK